MTGDCRSEEGVIVGLIDGMIAQARVIASYLRSNSPTAEVREALADCRADEDIATVTVPEEASALYVMRWSCPKCGRFIADDKVQQWDERDDGAYYGVTSYASAVCAKDGAITPRFGPITVRPVPAEEQR